MVKLLKPLFVAVRNHLASYGCLDLLLLLPGISQRVLSKF